MTIRIFSNPRTFVYDAKALNITYELLNEAIMCIGQQSLCKMFHGSSMRGKSNCISSASIQNWLATFEYVKNNPDKEDSDDNRGSRRLEKIDDLWDDYVKLIKTPISNDDIEYWKKLSNRKLGDEAIKHGITIGIRNSEAIKTLLDRMVKMVERRRVNFGKQ